MERLAIRAVFFDAVGTLIRPDPPVCEAYAFHGRRHGAALGPAEIDHRFRLAFQRQEKEDRAQQWHTDEPRERARWTAIVADVFHDQPAPTSLHEDLWGHFARASAWACFPDAAPILDWVSGLGIEVGVASNFDGRLRGVVAGLPELHACRHFAISSELGRRKPAAAFFEKLCGLGPWRPDQVLMVGDDWENDYQAARAAGLQALFLARAGERRGPDTISGLEQLRSYFATKKTRTTDGHG